LNDSARVSRQSIIMARSSIFLVNPSDHKGKKLATPKTQNP
jgi:hypothetical protein